MKIEPMALFFCVFSFEQVNDFYSLNYGLSYLLIDKDYSSMSIVTEPVMYQSKDILYVSCNLSDNRGFSALDTGSSKCVIHHNNKREGVNFSHYYENMFIVFSLLDGGSVSVNRTTGNQYGVTLMLY